MAGRVSKYNNDWSSTLTTPIWRVALYIRLSVEDGDDKIESNSISNQKQLLNEYLKENNEFTLYDYYVDDGYSGTDFNRPDFQRLLNDMKNKKINVVIVKDLSRLGRNYIEVGNYIEQIFPLFNIRFVAVNDNIDSYKDPKSVNNVMVPFKNLMNDEYCRDISNKIRSVFRVKKKNGEYVGAFAPYGYIKDPEDTHHLIVDPEAANIVKLIYKWSLEGMGRTSIAHKLNGMGILNPMGYRREVLKTNYRNKKVYNKQYTYTWDTVTLAKILKDEIYCGDMIQNRGRLISYKVHKHVKNPREDWIIVKNTHEAIIDRETFEKVQQAIMSRDTRVDKTGKLSVFAGHLKCADCERSMVKRAGSYYTNKPNPIFYYCCSTNVRRSKDLCTRHSIRNDVLESAVLEAIKMQIDLVIDADNVIKEISKAKKLNFRKESVENNIKRQEIELEKNKKLKKSIYEDWKLGMISEEDFFEYSKDYNEKIAKIEEKISYFNNEIVKIQDKPNDDSWIEKFKKNKNITVLSKEIIDELIDNIYVHEGGNITIVFNYEDEYKNAIEYIKQNQQELIANAS